MSTGVVGWITDLVGTFFDTLRKLGAGVVGKIFTGLGLGLASHQYAAPSLGDFLRSHLGAVGSDVLDVLTYINVDKALSMMIGAFVTKHIFAIGLVWLGAKVTGAGGSGGST